MSAGQGRCEAHGLAAGPDGLCALCRRVETPEPDLGAPRTTSRTIVAGGGIVMVIVCAAMAWPRPRATNPVAVEEPAAPTQREAVPTSPAQPAVEDHPGLIDPRTHTVPGTGSPPARSLAPTGFPLPSRQTQPAQDDTLIAARVAREASDLREARRRVSVTMYSTNWCPSCRAAREWLAAAGVSYTDLDVERDPSARATQRSLNPRGSVPTTDIDGHVLVGFSAGSFTSALDEAARRRAARF